MTSGHWENVFRKLFETVIYPSYLDAQAAQFQQFTVFWWPLSIEKSVLQKKCVFNQNQDAPCVFERKSQKKHAFCGKLTLSANAHRENEDHNARKGENALTS